ncbi:recombinase family protein [Brevundimonas sp. GCM10030266]|uniref:recombinase family protein n=1 Tax=Brevundimonas sp. GCM10030266 TaxID=3273386 RepID=UPI00360715B3
MTIHAAQYLRMSTERQDFSIPLQTAAIATYAAANGYEIVRSYADRGLSGLTAQGRPALQELLGDILSGSAGFSVLLVYDVSRLGRFQNPDEAAHYEFVCNDAGVRIEYCAETFSNDGGLSSQLLKNIKRIMAAEYSRELSAKVAKAQLALAAQGFWQGGRPGYGFRRVQILPNGALGRELPTGDRKGPQCGRTILVPGPEEEVRTVRRMFDLYVTKRMSVRAITRLLNGEGVRGPQGLWSTHTLYDILSNEKYVGTNIINKTVRRLGGVNQRQPRGDWVRAEGAFAPIVSRDLFDAAQTRRLRAARKFTDAEMIEGLKQLHRSEGKVTCRLVDDCPDLPSSQLYCRRFGSLLSACNQAGIAVRRRQEIAAERFRHSRSRVSPHNAVCGKAAEDLLPILKSLLLKRGSLTKVVIDEELGRGAYSAASYRFGGGRRMYALAGYKPTANQERAFDLSPSEGLTQMDADRVRERALRETLED